MRSHLGAEVGLTTAASWEGAERTDAFLFLGGGLSKSCLMNGAVRGLLLVLTRYLFWSLEGC